MGPVSYTHLYYGAYFCLAIPAAFINSRLGYKGGVLIGLVLAGTGGLLFIPAAYVMTYSVFLTALFTLAAGLSILETSANPFVMSMGPEHNATRRLNFAQAFNPIGSNLGVLLAALLILPKVNPATAEQRAAMSHEDVYKRQPPPRCSPPSTTPPWRRCSALWPATGCSTAPSAPPGSIC